MEQLPPPGYPATRPTFADPPMAAAAPPPYQSQPPPQPYASQGPWTLQPQPPPQPAHAQHSYYNQYAPAAPAPAPAPQPYAPPQQPQYAPPAQPYPPCSQAQPPSYAGYQPPPQQAPPYNNGSYSQPAPGNAYPAANAAPAYPPASYPMTSAPPPTSYPSQGYDYAANAYGQPPLQGASSAYGGMPPPPPPTTSYGGMPPPPAHAASYGGMPPPPSSAPTPQGYTQSYAQGQASYGGLQHQGSFPNASAPPMNHGGTSAGPGASASGNAHGCARPVQLDPYGLPVVLGDQRLERCRMRIEEKVFEGSGDSFYIMDERKNSLYTVDGSRTVDQYKVLKNASGGPLLTMRQTSSLNNKIVISDPQGAPLLTMVRARSDRDRKRVDGYLGAEQSGHPAVIVVGNSSASSFKIENNREMVVADVSRASRSVKRIVTGQDSYVVNVSVGSAALIAMIVVAIDEMFCDANH